MDTTTDTMLSRHFKLGDLVATNQSLSQPNMPSSQEQMNNLTYLARVLDMLFETIGPFNIISGFRTQELQQALGEGGNPVGPGTSFHELGRGIDLYPTTMGVEDFVARILVDPSLRNQFAEIIPKVPQHTVHLAINVEGDTRTPRILELAEGINKYVPMTEGEIDKLILPLLPEPELREAVVSEVKEASISPMVLLSAAALAIGATFLMGKKK